jgi:4-hydroxybenzoate polyprenyltransferase
MQWYRENKVLILSLLISVSFLITFLIISHFSVLFSKNNIFWSLLIPVLSIAYSFPFLPGGKALRHIGWLKLPLLSFVWSFATVVLPVFYSDLSTMSQPQILALFANRFFFIMALAMLFNVRDYEEDKKDKVVTPAVAFGPQKILFYGKGLMLFINIITGLLVCRYFNLYFTLQYIAVIIPVLFLFLLFHFFRFSRNEIEFSILHDGLIPVKALLLIFAANI